MKQQIAIMSLLFTIICANNAKAQQPNMQDKPGFIFGLTGGLSAPGGNYTKTDFNDPKSGFAGPGFNIGVTGTWFINKNWGINALISYHSYSFKGLQVLADGFKDAFAIDSSTVNTQGSNYSMNFLVGPYYSLPIGKKFSFDSRLLVGLVNAHLAGMQMFFEDQAASTFTQKESTANTFGLQLGIGGRYAISKHSGIMLNIDYFYSKPDFSINYENRNNNAGRWITSYNEPIAGLNTNLTLYYILHP